MKRTVVAVAVLLVGLASAHFEEFAPCETHLDCDIGQMCVKENNMRTCQYAHEESFTGVEDEDNDSINVRATKCKANSDCTGGQECVKGYCQQPDDPPDFLY